MAAYLLKSFGNSVARCLKRVSNCNRFGNTRANFHSTAWNLQTTCPDDTPFITRLAVPPDYDNVVEFMCEVFYKHEPTIVNSGLDCAEVPPVWRKMMDDQVRQGLSIIAENREHCIIGASLNNKLTKNDIQVLNDLAECCDSDPIQKILKFYSYVVEAPRLWERYCVDIIFEQCSLAVNPEYRGMGIAKALVQESWILARDCGFRLFRMDCNSSYGARICEGFGWEEVWRIPFSGYVSDCEIVFKCVKEPHTQCRVFIDHLQRCKTYCPPSKKCSKITRIPA